MTGKNLTKNLLTLTFVGLSALGGYNVMAALPELETAAKNEACSGECEGPMLGYEKTPFMRSYTFQTSLRLGTRVTVECQREFILIGEFHCVAKKAQ